MSGRLTRSLLIVVGATIASPAAAHDTWLSSRQAVARAGSTIDLDATSAHRFPKVEYAPAAARIDHASCRQQGATLALIPGARSATTLRLTVRSKSAGAVVCRLDLAPKDIDLKEATVDRYLDEIAAPDPVRRLWAEAAAPRQWHETYSKHAKVIVPGTTGDAVTTTTPLGAPLEFVPDVDLSTGRPDGRLKVRALRNGAPAAGLAVELVDGVDSRGTWQTTDDAGRIEFPTPGPGRWQLRTTDLRPADTGTGHWESHFATLVFTVSPALR